MAHQICQRGSSWRKMGPIEFNWIHWIQRHLRWTDMVFCDVQRWFGFCFFVCGSGCCFVIHSNIVPYFLVAFWEHKLQPLRYSNIQTSGRSFLWYKIGVAMRFVAVVVSTSVDPVVSRFHQNCSFSQNFPFLFCFQLDRVVDIGKLYISPGGFRTVSSCPGTASGPRVTILKRPWPSSFPVL